jgi:hypothetical protein
MSALGTHEITGGIGLGLEPPLSAPVVRGAEVHAPSPAVEGLVGLPTPPPAIRPPGKATPTNSSITPEPELQAMAPVAEPVEPAAASEPVHDYFAAPGGTEPEVESQPAQAQIRLAPVGASETELPPLVAPADPEPEPDPEPDLEPAAEAGTSGFGFRVVVRLQGAEGVEIGGFGDFATARKSAQEVVEQVASGAGGAWPFYAGRFICPDVIVSVDVVEAGS